MEGDRAVRPAVERWKPAASKPALLFLGGSVWAAAGSLLVLRGFDLFSAQRAQVPFFAAIGLIGAALFYKLVFEQLSFRYVGRILALAQDRPCIFSFLSVRGYLTMALMIGMGIGLRLSGFLPANALGSLFVAIGLTLTCSSVRFYRQGFLLL